MTKSFPAIAMLIIGFFFSHLFQDICPILNAVPMAQASAESTVRPVSESISSKSALNSGLDGAAKSETAVNTTSGERSKSVVNDEDSSKIWMIAFFVAVVALVGVVVWYFVKKQNAGSPGSTVIPPPGAGSSEQILLRIFSVIEKQPQPSSEQKRVLAEYRLKYSELCRDAELNALHNSVQTQGVASLAVAWAFIELHDIKSAWEVVPMSQIIPLVALPVAATATPTVGRKWNIADASPAVRLELQRARILNEIAIGAGFQTVRDGKSAIDVASASFGSLASSSQPIAVEVEAQLGLSAGWNKAVDILYDQLNKEQSLIGASAARNLALPLASLLLERTLKLISAGRGPSVLGQLPNLINEIAKPDFHVYGSRSSNQSQDDLRLPGLYCEVVTLWMSRNPGSSPPLSLLDVANSGLQNLEGTGKWILEGKAPRNLIVEARIKSKEYSALARSIIEDWMPACKLEDPSGYKLKMDRYADDLLECAQDDPAGWTQSFVGEGELEGEIRQFAAIDSVKEPPVLPGVIPTQSETLGKWRFLDDKNQFCDMGWFGGKDAGEVRKAVFYVFNSPSQKQCVHGMKVQVKCGTETLTKIGAFGHPIRAEEGMGQQETRVAEECHDNFLPKNTEFTTLFTPVLSLDFACLSVPIQPNGHRSKLQIVSRVSQDAQPEVEEIDVFRTAPAAINSSRENAYPFSALVGIICGLDDFTPEGFNAGSQVSYLLNELVAHIGGSGQAGMFSDPMYEGSLVTFAQFAQTEEAKARRSERLPKTGMMKSPVQVEAENHFQSLLPAEVRAAFARFIDIQFGSKKIGAQAYSRLTFLKMPVEPKTATQIGQARTNPLPQDQSGQPIDFMSRLARAVGSSVAAVRSALPDHREAWISMFAGDVRQAELVAWLRNGRGY